MARSFHGLVLVDKPTAWTSHDVVAKARRLLQTKKIGHAGTLDPGASGLLILLVGHATKLSDYLLNGDKSYACGIRLGVETDTLDMTGEVLKEAPVTSSLEEIRQQALEMQGELELPVPKYSAVKVNGRRLYKYALSNTEVEEVYRRSFFEKVAFSGLEGDVVQVEMSCSKGAFVRAWAAELGRRLGCGGAVETLRRTASSPYDLSTSVTIEALAAAIDDGSWRDHSAVIPLEKTLPEAAALSANTDDERLLLNGVLGGGLKAELLQSFRPQIEGGELIKVVSQKDGWLLALLSSSGGAQGAGSCKIRRVFQRA